MKRIFLIALVFSLLSTPTMAACEGFNNALGALEAAVHKPQQTTPKLNKTSAQIRRINESLDDLEKAIKAHQQKQILINAPKPAKGL